MEVKIGRTEYISGRFIVADVQPTLGADPLHRIHRMASVSPMTVFHEDRNRVSTTQASPEVLPVFLGSISRVGEKNHGPAHAQNAKEYKGEIGIDGKSVFTHGTSFREVSTRTHQPSTSEREKIGS